MATFKLTISDTKGRSITRELKDAEANQLIGASIGTEFDAAPLELGGKLVITGGGDKSGVPMRDDVHGSARKYVMLSRGVGLPRAHAGQRVRKLVRGRDISEEIFQINCKYDGVLEQKPKDEDAKNAAEPGAKDGAGDKGKEGAAKPESKADDAKKPAEPENKAGTGDNDKGGAKEPESKADDDKKPPKPEDKAGAGDGGKAESGDKKPSTDAEKQA